MRKSIVTVLAALAASIAAPAVAEEATVTISYADLDLAKPADMAALKGRIAEAVDTVCAKVEPRFERGLTAWRDCKVLTLADAMEQLAAIKPAPSVALAASSEN